MASEIAPQGTSQAAEKDRTEPIKPRQQLEDTEMDITPMIDITFLLLIFFLVASKMDESTSVKLPSTKTGMNVAVKEAVIITVGVGQGEGTAAVYKGDGATSGNEIDYSDVESLEKGIIEYVEDVASRDSFKKWVLIKGAKGVKFKHIHEVAKAAANVEQITNMAVGVMQEN